MELGKNSKHKDKIEITKQQIVEIQKVYDSTIIPQKNHTLFEINLLEFTITEATYDHQPEIQWADAVRGFITTKRKITKKENCIYISSLNVKNVKKILKRDHQIIIP